MTSPPPEHHLSLKLQGVVQGVGFRPHVVRLAEALGLRGSVANSSSGVQLELEGSRQALEAFSAQLLRNPPAQARIDHHQLGWSTARSGQEGVQILPSQTHGAPTALPSPDLALCRDCLRELEDPSNRRHGYPFISCTHCGPRYSVLERLPFEREHTSFQAFPPCAICAREYGEPADRRFHAQTISCPHCGPQLLWNGEPCSSATAIEAATHALQAGAIVAVQAVGGFQLLVDPANGKAVQRLRARKGRPDKPLALLALEPWLEQHCHSSPEEQALWWSAAAPIVLLRRKGHAAEISGAVAGDSAWLGVMRASSGLQQLLLQRSNGALVATSANRSGEPICRDATADAAQLHQLADHVLSHTLPLLNRIDDSVLRWAAQGPLVLRLGRGLAPMALPIGSAEGSGSLAVGAQMKGALAVQTASHRLLSPDLGDISSLAGAEHHRRSCRRWLERHGLVIGRLVCDQHPGYSSSAWASTLAAREQLPLLTVQHHHAHLLAVMAEHHLSGPALGVAWDGAGQGDDGSLWGGEALAVTANSYRRIAMLRPWPLPGGERAQREPRRAALGLLLAAYGSRWRDRLTALPELSWRQAFSGEEVSVLERSVERDVNCPLASSVGRLFDAVAALLGLAQRCSYEAQAAMALEGLALEALVQPGLAPFPLALPLDRPQVNAPWQWNWQPLLELLLDGLAAAVPAGALALSFHRALAGAIADLAAAEGAQQLLLAGGCFQNALLLELSNEALAQQGCQALWPQQLPSNDAALPIGQLLAAETMPINRVAPQAMRHVSGRCR
jgi:hydrogenase maturation protein HypF